MKMNFFRITAAVFAFVMIVNASAVETFAKNSLTIDLETNRFTVEKIADDGISCIQPKTYDCLDVRDYGHHRYQARFYTPRLIGEGKDRRGYYELYSQVIECVCGRQMVIEYKEY